MSSVKIRLDQIEGGQTLKRLVWWFRRATPSFAARFDDLRLRSRASATRAGLTPKQIDRLITDVRA